VWDLPGVVNDLLGERSFESHNHTWKFGDLPEGGEDAETVYVLFRDDVAKKEDESGVFYFNSMYQYEPEENVYYRYAIDDMDNPENNAILFQEQLIANPTITSSQNDGLEGGHFINDCTLYKGEAITFANVIVQYIDMEWPGLEAPYPILTGTGNADYFMGGKRYTGVWKRDELDDRTVYYGADGQEITLQPGRTFIVLMDYKSENRAVKYE